MKISGIICEYNPFHNGHMYHISETRRHGATHIVAVMSGNFVQRGDTAVMNKFERAKIAVKCGADLVIELPVAYSTATAEVFARGAVYILNAMGCVDELSFGSENGDIEMLNRAVEASRKCSVMPALKEMLESGKSYPQALNELISITYGDEISELFNGPNNLLAVEYLKALEFLKSPIKPFTITRKDVEHDGIKVFGNIASASFIRQSIDTDNDFSDYIPDITLAAILNAAKFGTLANFSNLERALLYKVRTMQPDEFTSIPDVGQGLENRIFSARNAVSIKELFMQIKTKRYPMARIRRIMLNMLLEIQKSDINVPPPYGRILAINDKGCEILAAAKGKTKIPFGTSLAKLSNLNSNAKHFAELEAKASDIYGLASRSIQSCELDYKAKVTINEA